MKKKYNFCCKVIQISFYLPVCAKHHISLFQTWDYTPYVLKSITV